MKTTQLNAADCFLNVNIFILASVVEKADSQTTRPTESQRITSIKLTNALSRLSLQPVLTS